MAQSACDGDVMLVRQQIMETQRRLLSLIFISLVCSHFKVIIYLNDDSMSNGSKILRPSELSEFGEEQVNELGKRCRKICK